MDRFKSFLPQITELQWQQLQHYEVLLLEWNEKINLVSRKDTEFLFEKHILPVLPAITLRCFDTFSLGARRFSYSLRSKRRFRFRR